MTEIIEQNSENHVEETSAPSLSVAAEHDVSTPGVSCESPLPSFIGEDQTPVHLANLADRARGYVEAASSANTRKAYASDWKHFSAWCRRSNLAPLPPHPQTVELYITACASGSAERGAKANSVSTIERRLSSLSWNYAQRGLSLDRKERHIAAVMAGIRNSHAKPSVQKEAVMAEDIIAMVETLDRGSLRGLRDRAMLLIGFAGGLRRSEIVGLDLKADQTEDGRGWIEILDKGMLITLRGKTGWREVEVGRGSADATCPVAALESWIKFAKIARGPLFRRVTGQGKDVGPDRLNDQEVARLVKKTALAAGVRGDLPEMERGLKFAGHSLRAGLASSAEVDERYVQKGHASAEMTRRYQRRRDRFRVNLTKASGLWLRPPCRPSACTKTVRALDGLIAATAPTQQLTLATRNTKDFEGFGVDIINPTPSVFPPHAGFGAWFPSPASTPQPALSARRNEPTMPIVLQPSNGAVSLLG